MASRLTTNQEIAGSTPAVVIIFLNLNFIYLTFCPASLNKHGLFLLISFIRDIPETLLDGWKVRLHLPQVAYTYTCVIHS